MSDFYEELYTFKVDSTLKNYLSANVNFTQLFRQRIVFSFKDVFFLIWTIVKLENLFDPNNCVMILCSEEMEYVFQVKALHIAQLPNMIEEHFVPYTGPLYVPKFLYNGIYGYRPELASPRIYVDLCSPSVQSLNIYGPFLPMKLIPDPVIEYDLDSKFFLRNELRQALSSEISFPNQQFLFSLNTLSIGLANFLENQRDDHDPRNPNVFLFNNNPLGEVFGVKACHKLQLKKLLLRHLVPIDVANHYVQSLFNNN